MSYSFKEKLSKLVHLFISRILSAIKGEEFILDKAIPIWYLFHLLVRRGMMIVRGFLIFRRRVLCFVDNDVKLFCKGKIGISHGVTIQRNVFIDALSIDGVQLGRNVSIGKNCTIECTGSLRSIGKGLVVGDGVGMGAQGFWGCAGGIVVGSNTIFGNFVSLHSENHNYDDINRPIRCQGVNRIGIKIGKDCWIGAKVTILDGVEIEDGCVIAAGAVLTKGVYQKNGVYGGVPAKLIGKRG